MRIYIPRSNVPDPVLLALSMSRASIHCWQIRVAASADMEYVVVVDVITGFLLIGSILRLVCANLKFSSTEIASSLKG